MNLRLPCFGIALALLAIPTSRLSAADSIWTPASVEELAPSWRPMEPDSAVEMLFWRVDVDDRDYPRDRRTTEYLRYKILIPAKANEVMRISRTNLMVNGIMSRRYDIRARLTQPDGKIKELGSESILSRPATRTRRDRNEWGDFGADIERTEKYLAISGAERGAILEVQIVARESYAPQLTAAVLQLEGIPIHKLDYTFRAGNEEEYQHRFYVLNNTHAKLTEQPKKLIFNVSGANLPSLVDEPFSGTTTDYALTVFGTYIPYTMGGLMAGGGSMTRQIDPKAGPWAVYASVVRWFEEDRSQPTAKVKKAAVDLTNGAASEVDKAKRIHQRVRGLHREFSRRAKSRESAVRSRGTGPSLDRALELGPTLDDNLRDEDFLYLALSLYRSAGLKAEIILLPDRTVARLDRKLASPVFLPEECIAIQIGERWHFSMPTSPTPLAFDELPWRNQGQGGLLARENRQDFIDVPLGAPSQSVRTTFGLFRLDESGTLSGAFRHIFTGQPAYELRNELLDQDLDHQKQELKKAVAERLKGAEVTVVKIEHLENPESPIEVTYEVTWPGYAVLTADRLILRPSVFRAQLPPAFTSTTRRNRVILPFRWHEIDRVGIEMPPNYVPESMASPPPMPGEVLAYKVAMSFEEPKRLLHLRRDFMSAAITVPTDKYPDLKQWHDTVSNNDQHELVFIRRDAAAPAPSATGAAAQ